VRHDGCRQAAWFPANQGELLSLPTSEKKKKKKALQRINKPFSVIASVHGAGSLFVSSVQEPSIAWPSPRINFSALIFFNEDVQPVSLFW